MQADSDAARHFAFLQSLQRLLDEGQFVASYKFALLLAIAQLCVEREPAADGSLHLSLEELAARVIELYWPQVAPFRDAGILHQNTGKPAAILRRVATAREGSASFAAARRHKSWSSLVRQVAKTVKEMPLGKLQVVGGGPNNFLYEPQLEYGGVRLKPGVARSFRVLNEFVVALVQMAWIRYLHRVPANHAIIGPNADLASFLFGCERNVLIALREPLRDIQRAHCFYCRRRLSDGGEVDHFIPWVRYPRDLGHNFVLAHASCNAAKSDMLADIPHLSAWCERNAKESGALLGMFEIAKTHHDQATSRQVATWAYESTARSSGFVWLAGSAGGQPIGPGWREILQ